MDTQDPTHSPALSAVILSGGKSVRMGRTKALLPFGERPLIAHLIQRLSQRFSDIVVVAAPDQTLPSLPVTLVHDEVAHQGPVGGMYYGLRAIRGTAAFVTSCDAPFSSFLSSTISSRSLTTTAMSMMWSSPFGKTGFSRFTPCIAGASSPIYKNNSLPNASARSICMTRCQPEKWSRRRSNALTPRDSVSSI